MCIRDSHLAVDDATGEVVGAYFDNQETLKGYYNVFYQILTNYGIPAMFYTDRRTVFEYKRKNNAFDDEDTFTPVSYTHLDVYKRQTLLPSCLILCATVTIFCFKIGILTTSPL